LGANDAPFSRAPRRPAGEGRVRGAGESVCGSPHLTPAPGSRPGQALSPQRAEREIQRVERGKLRCGDARCGDARRAAGSARSGRLVGLAVLVGFAGRRGSARRNPGGAECGAGRASPGGSEKCGSKRCRARISRELGGDEFCDRPAAGRPNLAPIRSYLRQSPEFMNSVLRPLVEVTQ